MRRSVASGWLRRPWNSSAVSVEKWVCAHMGTLMCWILVPRAVVLPESVKVQRQTVSIVPCCSFLHLINESGFIVVGNEARYHSVVSKLNNRSVTVIWHKVMCVERVELKAQDANLWSSSSQGDGVGCKLTGPLWLPAVFTEGALSLRVLSWAIIYKQQPQVVCICIAVVTASWSVIRELPHL